MRFNVISMVVAMLLLTISPLEAQQRTQLEPEKLTMIERDGEILISFELNVPKGYVQSAQQYLFTPLLTDYYHTMPLTSVIIDGKRYTKVTERGRHNKHMKHKMLLAPDMSDAIRLMATKEARVIKYSESVPYEDWMQQAKLILVERYNSRSNTLLIAEDIYSDGVELTSIIAGGITDELILYFDSGKTEIIHTPEIDGFIAKLEQLCNCPNSVIDSVVVCASSSPEGSFMANEMLAIARAENIKRHICDRLSSLKSVEDKIIIATNVANWSELRSAIAESDMVNRDALLAVIDNPNSQSRMWRLKSMPEYGHIEDNIFPALRYVKCKIHYNTNNSEPIIEAKGDKNVMYRSEYSNHYKRYRR